VSQHQDRAGHSLLLPVRYAEVPSSSLFVNFRKYGQVVPFMVSFFVRSLGDKLFVATSFAPPVLNQFNDVFQSGKGGGVIPTVRVLAFSSHPKADVFPHTPCVVVPCSCHRVGNSSPDGTNASTPLMRYKDLARSVEKGFGT